MKLTIFLLLLGVFQVQANTYGQKNITIQVQQSAIEKVLNRIEQNSDYRFLYNYDLASLKKKVNLDVENTPVEEALKKLFSGTDLTYRLLENNLIVIHSSVQQMQDIRITGQVKSATGEPLGGVTIRVKDRPGGTNTDNLGNYTITVPDNAILIVSSIGYETQEVAVEGKQVVNITLVESQQQMEQVVVVGYGTQRRRDVTSAISVIGAKELEDRPIVSALQGIQGKAAGVQVVQPSGKPGAGLAVSIRGNTSLTASNSPLYVVDGVPTNDINYINPADIESFSVLKDASAAAIYGASGANGVVLITTRKGSSRKTAVRFQTYQGFSKVEKTIDVLDRTQYLALMTELGYADPGTHNTNWQDMVFGSGRESNYQMSVSGGSEGSQYFTSLGYQKQEGVVAPSEYERYSARLNLNNKVSKRFNISTNIGFTKSTFVDVQDNAGVARGGTILSTLTTPPTIGVFNPDGTYTSNPNKGGWENPISNAFAAWQESSDHRILGNVQAEIFIIPGLTFKSNLGADYRTNRYDYFLDPNSTDWGRQNKGIGIARSSQQFVWLNENTFNYKKEFGDHSLNALAGMTVQESTWEGSYAEGHDFPNASVRTLNAARERIASTTTVGEWSKRSYLARLGYSFMDRYLFTSNFRADGSSRFPEDNRYGFFPSFSAGWRLSEEAFLNDVDWLTDLKLRAGWGMIGNDEGIGDYSYYQLFAPTGTGGFSPRGLANEELQWETTTQTNIGIDASLFNNRVTVTIDGYLKKTTDLLVNVQLPPSSGADVQTLNVGAMENKGFEFQVSSRNFVGDFSWSTDLNFSTNKNKVTSLGVATKELNFGGIYERGDAILVREGLPLGTFFGYISDGVDPQTGMIVYRDLDKDGAITPEGDRTIIGYAQPKFVYGMTNNFSYKNFELSVFLQGVTGNDMFNASRIDLESMNDSKNQTTDVLRRWTSPGQVTDIPVAVKESTDNTRISSRFVEKGAYMRIKSMTLSYNIPAAPMKRLGITRASIYATGQNLLTITDYKGFDPEVSQYGGNGASIGIDYGTYPQARTIIFGLNVEF